MSKPRSPLLTMPDEQQAKLAKWLIDGMHYSKARELCGTEFGIKFRSDAPLNNFWEVVCWPGVLARRRRAVQSADSLYEESSKQASHFEEATIDQLKQRAFEMMLKPQTDPKEVKALLALTLKVRDQDLDKGRLALDQQKFDALLAREAEAKDAAKYVELTPEEKEARIKEIFGI